MQTLVRQKSTTTTAELVCELCRQFYGLGWVSGTGGGIAIRDEYGIRVAPSGVQKERLRPEDIFLIDGDAALDPSGIRIEVLESPMNERLKLSECLPLFLNAFRTRGAGAVLHSHSIWAVLGARLFSPDGKATVPEKSEFRCRGLEMQKGLRGVGSFDLLRVPIIPNTARECDLTESMAEAMERYPDVDAVIVAGHGIYVWGKSWVQAKTQAECLDYLLRASVEAARLGLPIDRD